MTATPQRDHNRLAKGLDFKLGSIAGMGCLLLSALLYRSSETRPVLNRWSYTFTGFVGLVFIAWLFAVWRGVRAARRPVEPAPHRNTSGRLFEAAAFLWGLAYLVASLRQPSAGARVLDLDLVGSIDPFAAVLEWLALVAVFAAIVSGVAPRFTGNLGGLWLTAATLVALLLVLEGLARAKAIVLPATQGFPTHSSTLWTNRFVELNRSGFRDTEHSERAAGGSRRLLVIGDSFAFGVGIKDPAERFGERLAARLGGDTGARWESINASRRDTHTLDHIQFLEGTVRYRPDVVLLIYVFNDIDYLRQVTERGHLTDLNAPLQRLQPLRILFLNSYAFQELMVRLRHLRFQAGASLDDARPRRSVNAYADSAVVGKHLQDVKRLVDAAQQTGALVAVVPFDLRVLLGSPFQERYARFVRQAQALGIRTWPLSDAFQGQDYRSLIVNSFDHHPNERAHDLAAAFVAKRVLNTSAERDSASNTRTPGRN